MDTNTKFKRVLREQDAAIYSNPNNIRRVIFCSGKIYYELLDYREKNNITDVALCRLEQIAPFAWDKTSQEMAHYPNADAVFCQEEPKNMGAWSYVQPRIATGKY